MPNPSVQAAPAPVVAAHAGVTAVNTPNPIATHPTVVLLRYFSTMTLLDLFNATLRVALCAHNRQLCDVRNRVVTEQRSSRDERISAAALDLLRTKGPAAVTVEAVAARSGVAKTTI